METPWVVKAYRRGVAAIAGNAGSPILPEISLLRNKSPVLLGEG